MSTVTCFIYIGKEDTFHGGIRPRVIGHFYENEASTGISIYKKSKGSSGFEYVGGFLPEWKTTEDPITEDSLIDRKELRFFSHPITYMIIASFREPCAKSDKLKEISKKTQKKTYNPSRIGFTWIIL